MMWGFERLIKLIVFLFLKEVVINNDFKGVVLVRKVLYFFFMN